MKFGYFKFGYFMVFWSTLYQAWFQLGHTNHLHVWRFRLTTFANETPTFFPLPSCQGARGKCSGVKLCCMTFLLYPEWVSRLKPFCLVKTKDWCQAMLKKPARDMAPNLKANCDQEFRGKHICNYGAVKGLK